MDRRGFFLWKMWNNTPLRVVLSVMALEEVVVYSIQGRGCVLPFKGDDEDWRVLQL